MQEQLSHAKFQLPKIQFNMSQTLQQTSRKSITNSLLIQNNLNTLLNRLRSQKQSFFTAKENANLQRQLMQAQNKQLAYENLQQQLQKQKQIFEQQVKEERKQLDLQKQLQMEQEKQLEMKQKMVNDQLQQQYQAYREKMQQDLQKLSAEKTAFEQKVINERLNHENQLRELQEQKQALQIEIARLKEEIEMNKVSKQLQVSQSMQNVQDGKIITKEQIEEDMQRQQQEMIRKTSINVEGDDQLEGTVRQQNINSSNNLQISNDDQKQQRMTLSYPQFDDNDNVYQIPDQLNEEMLKQRIPIATWAINNQLQKCLIQTNKILEKQPIIPPQQKVTVEQLFGIYGHQYDKRNRITQIWGKDKLSAQEIEQYKQYIAQE